MGVLDYAVDGIKSWYENASTTEVVLVGTTVSLSTLYLMKRYRERPPKGVKMPPRIPGGWPFLGHAIEFGQNPIAFLKGNYEKYGPVYTFHMMGRDCTYVIGSEASALMFNSKNEEMDPRPVYGNLTIPVFGKGVVYDVDPKEFAEQKRLIKAGLTVERFKAYVPLIEEETVNYFKRMGEEGEFDLLQAMSQLIVMTASRCLLGGEIRAMLDESVAQLLADLDGGFSTKGWLLPYWLPIPSFHKRNQAHRKLVKLFVGIENARCKDGNVHHDDLISTLMTNTYRDGTELTPEQVAGLCIATLLAGQHTSSTTSAWMGFFIATRPELQKLLRNEVTEVMGPDGHATYAGLKELENMDNTLRETLRIRPPIMTMIRDVVVPQQIMGYTIPAGNYCCASPTTNQILEDAWVEPTKFNPDRFKGKNVEEGAAENQLPGNGRYSYVPFGAGRHRCIGEVFAYTQIKTIWATILREFELSKDELPQIDYSTMIHMPKGNIVHYRRLASPA